MGEIYQDWRTSSACASDHFRDSGTAAVTRGSRPWLADAHSRAASSTPLKQAAPAIRLERARSPRGAIVVPSGVYSEPAPVGAGRAMPEAVIPSNRSAPRRPSVRFASTSEESLSTFIPVVLFDQPTRAGSSSDPLRLTFWTLSGLVSRFGNRSSLRRCCACPQSHFHFRAFGNTRHRRFPPTAVYGGLNHDARTVPPLRRASATRASRSPRSRQLNADPSTTASPRPRTGVQGHTAAGLKDIARCHIPPPSISAATAINRNRQEIRSPDKMPHRPWQNDFSHEATP